MDKWKDIELEKMKVLYILQVLELNDELYLKVKLYNVKH